MMTDGNRISRKNALSMKEVVDIYIREMKLSSGLNTQIVFKAWNEVSGAGQYTLRRFYRDGVLTITLSSSMVRNTLFFQRETLVKRINEYLEKDSLFMKDDARVSFVKELILK